MVLFLSFEKMEWHPEHLVMIAVFPVRDDEGSDLPWWHLGKMGGMDLKKKSLVTADTLYIVSMGRRDYRGGKHQEWYLMPSFGRLIQ